MALACTAITAAVPPIEATSTAAVSAAIAGRRWHQSQEPLSGPDPPGGDRPRVEPRSQVIRQGLCACVPPSRVLLQALQADRLEVARDLRVEPRRRLGRPAPHRVERVDHALAAERGLARKQGVEDRPQAVDVGRRGDRSAMPRRLLGAHVCRRSQDHAGSRHLEVGLDPLGQAEVGDVRMPLVIDQDVGRLQVAMQDAPHMGMVHSLGRLGQKRCRGPGIVLEGRELLGEVSPLDELHAEVLLTLMVANFINRHDPRVIQQCDGLGLVLESPQLRVVSQHAGPDHLEGDRPVEADLAGLVDHAHAAAAQFPVDLIVADIAHANPAKQITRWVIPVGCPGQIGGAGCQFARRREPDPGPCLVPVDRLGLG